MYQEKERKNEKGITLIALIITIIVLLILAGVSISMVVGENGILNHATRSSIETEKAKIKESIELEVMGSYDENGYLEIERLNDNFLANLNGILVKKGENYSKLSTSNKIEKLPTRVKYKNIEVEISKDGKATIIENTIVLPDSNSENQTVKIGSVIVNNVPLEKDWQFFYKDDEYVYLIYEDYLESNAIPTLESSTIGYNDNYSVYSNNNREDLIDYLSGNGIYNEIWNELKNGIEKALLSKNISKDQLSMIKITGAPDILLFEKAYNEKYLEDNFKVKYYENIEGSNGEITKGYFYSIDSNNFNRYIGLKDKNIYNDKMFFPHQESVDNCEGYWMLRNFCQ